MQQSIVSERFICSGGRHEDPRIARLQAICDANIAEYGLVDATGKDG
jgi:hypothetical protein